MKKILLILALLFAIYSNGQTCTAGSDIKAKRLGICAAPTVTDFTYINVYDGTGDKWINAITKANFKTALGLPAAYNFVPLAGTDTGAPVTGNIQVQNHADGDFQIYNDYSRLIFQAQVTSIGSLDPTGSNGISEMSFGGGFGSWGAFNSDYSKYTSITTNFDGVSLSQTGNSAFKGLDGSAYWGVNYTDNTYVQKKYVDDAIAAIPPSDAAGDGTTITAGVIAHEDLTANSLTTVADVWSRDVRADRDLILTAQTPSTVAIINGSNRVISADTAVYPSLTELSYVKGVTSAIQTQLNAKEPAISGTGFVYSTSGTKSVVSDTGTGNVVRDTSPTVTTPTVSGLVTHNGGTLTGSSAATMFQSMTGTYNGTGVFKGVFMNVTNTASNSQSRLIDLQTGGNSKFNVNMLGDAYASNSLTSGGYVEAGATSFLSWTTRSRVYSPANGDFLLTNAAASGFGKLQFGGTTSSFPAVKRNGATIEIRLADDSDFAAVQTLYDRFGTGSPEGVVTAPVSAVYHRTDGGAGTALYVKESGTGNTGWVAK